MNGPNPVWMLATKRLSPSRPRHADAVSSRSGLLRDIGTDIAGSFMNVDRRRRRGRRRHCHGARRAGLVFRSGRDLRAIEAELDRPRPPERREVQRFPVYCYSAAADTEKPAEVDHRSARPSVRVDQDIDDEPQILAVRPLDLFAQYRSRVA